MARRIGFGARPKLSTSGSARRWIAQFKTADQASAAALLDAILLLNEADVGLAIRNQLRKLAASRKGPRKKVALYVEREFAEAAIFKSELIADREGCVRRRAVGNNGPDAVRPRRGSTRVGSEGQGAFLVSQAAENTPQIFLNGPGPDRIRRHKASLIVIVTDFIGSGTRVNGMLDKFMRVPSVRSWRSLGLVNFVIVTAASTTHGKAAVEAHRTRPSVLATHIPSSLRSYKDPDLAMAWEDLARRYGPTASRGAGPLGFKNLGALIAFSYRPPNNLPLLLHAKGGVLRPLFQGAVTDDLGPAFGLRSAEQRIEDASGSLEHPLNPLASVEESQLALVLSVVRGRWREGQEIEIAERTELTVPEVENARAYALTHGLMTSRGHLTDAGQRHISTLTARHHPPIIPTEAKPYYPKTLRVPR